jgi:hypothetical protein
MARSEMASNCKKSEAEKKKTENRERLSQRRRLRQNEEPN